MESGERLGYLFSLVERNVSNEEIEQAGLPAITIGTSPGQAFTIRGEAYYLLHDLAEEIARSTHLGPGLSLEGARHLLQRACDRSLVDGADAAAEWLRRTLAGSPGRWIVVRPLAIGMPETVIHVGRCRIQRGLPPGLPFDPPDHVRSAFPAHSISSEVEAWDEDAAVLTATKNFEEAFAILRPCDRHGQPLLGSDLLVTDGERMTFAPSRGMPLHLFQCVSSEGELIFGGVRAMSEAARRPSSAQTDWERRTITAARWVSKGLDASWPSDALVSFMIALEALFLPPKGAHRKKEQLSAAISKRVRLRSMTPEAFRDWLKDVYDRRNDIVHESLAFDDEIEVDRLGDVAWIAVGWAAAHLNPYHRREQRPCTTLDEVLKCDPIQAKVEGEAEPTSEIGM